MMENEKIDEIITHIYPTSVRKILLNRFIIPLIVVTILVTACSRDIPADPMCRTDPQYSETVPSPAACLIKSNRKLLAIKNRTDDGWNLPMYKLQRSVSAQCTAHKAVWRNTGFNVEVGELLFTAKNQTQYFACKLTDDYSSQLTVFTVPPWANRTVQHIALIDPFETQKSQWVNHINLINVREAYNQLE